jgi:predicted nucleic acid-binding protein
MEPALLGIVLDSSVLIAAEAIESLQRVIGELPVVLSPVTIAEVGHGIYRANTPAIRERRRLFLDELKATVPVYPVTDATAEIVARIGGEQSAKGVNLPLAISSSQLARWNSGTPSGPATRATLVASLVHELGHAMDDIFGSGTNLFLNNDAGNTTLSNMNDDLIKQFCDF